MRRGAWLYCSLTLEELNVCISVDAARYAIMALSILVQSRYGERGLIGRMICPYPCSA